MASLIGRIAVGQIVPGSAGAQHPKNPVEHGAGILPWSPSLPNWFRVKERLQNRPLGVGEVHVAISRSEERRVGKECRSRWGQTHETEKHECQSVKARQ